LSQYPSPAIAGAYHVGFASAYQPDDPAIQPKPSLTR